MAKEKKSKAKSYDVDFDDYDEKEGSGYEGQTPKKGTYDGKLVSFREHTTSDTALEWVFEITAGDYSGWRGWTYSDMDRAKWKTQQITKALNGGSESKFKLQPIESGGDGSESPTVQKAKPVRLRLGREIYDDEPRAKIRQVMPADEKSSKGKKGKKKKDSEDPF